MIQHNVYVGRKLVVELFKIIRDRRDLVANIYALEPNM